MKICPKCGSINSDGSNNCTKCGSALGASVHGQSGQKPIPQRPASVQPARQPMRPQNPVSPPPQSPTSSQNVSVGATSTKKPSSGKTAFLIGAVLLLLVLVGGGVLVSSNNRMTEKEIDATYGSGVVLVMNSGYYEVVLSNGESVYFSSYSQEEGLENFTFDSDSIVSATSFGTGFFVSSDGKIATNNHVVASDVTEKQVGKQMKYVFTQIKENLSEKYNAYKEYDKQLIATIRRKYLYDQDYSEEYALSDALEDEMKKLQKIYAYVDDINPSDVELKYHSTISIAYNDTYITNTSDFVPCVVKSTDSEHDLAIIQLKDKKSPTGKYVFEVTSDDQLTSYSLGESIMQSLGKDKNEKIVMIGFNQGTRLAFTKEGIKAQCTSGSISQDDTDKIMYTIPALHGSSGSPVLNQRGQVVAVNFAGIDATQSFNYGVKARHLYNLLNK